MAGTGQQLKGQINIPIISSIRLGNSKQTISSNTRNHNLRQRTYIPIRSIQETFNYIQQNQIPSQKYLQYVMSQQIQQQDDSNLIYTKEKIKKLKDEKIKLHLLLTDTEEKFKRKLDKVRRKSEDLQDKQSRVRGKRLKDTNHMYLNQIKQQMVLSRIQEQELIKLRKEQQRTKSFKLIKRALICILLVNYDLGTGQSINLDSNKIKLPDFFKQQSMTSNLMLANIGDNKLIEENSN
ncbi:UNKNOWN [Stylonychia lemnae]|uniref:Uncharacterized protein n=1 Tax=Stylonychia lemnae TaxID=5949 RepID=A0A078B6C7_STYLE|nr:UNKNOWN [Stylonychia lemnae]|eukprot:CDW89776.1 UNKNOWN [Stylonychia lemnae]